MTDHSETDGCARCGVAYAVADGREDVGVCFDCDIAVLKECYEEAVKERDEALAAIAAAFDLAAEVAVRVIEEGGSIERRILALTTPDARAHLGKLLTNAIAATRAIEREACAMECEGAATFDSAACSVSTKCSVLDGYVAGCERSAARIRARRGA